MKNTLSYDRANWRTKGSLPHYDGPAIQFVTYCLHDAIPTDPIEIERHDNEPADVFKRRRSEQILDMGFGNCLLGIPENADDIVSAWKHFDGIRYDLLEYVVMPNHAHLMFYHDGTHRLDQLVHSWKSYTAHIIAKRSNVPWVWQQNYYDRFIRNPRHYEAVRRYIRRNPVVAGLVENEEDWKWSSAFEG